MNFTLAKCFNCFIWVISVLFIIFYTSNVSAAPTPTYALLNSFLQFLNKENCRMPSAVDIPFDTELEESNPWNFLSTPLHICETVDNINSKVSYTLCTEIFDAVANISCIKNQSTQLPNIKIKITTDVCQDFQRMEDIFSVNPDYIGKRLAADKVICSVICSGKEMEACKFLLWTYEVQKQIDDYLNNSNNLQHTSVVYNEIQDSANLGPEEITKIPDKDSNSDLQEPAVVKNDRSSNHADPQDEANKQASNEIIDTQQADNPPNIDVVNDQKPVTGNENTQSMSKTESDGKDSEHKDGDEKETQQNQNKLNEMSKELTPKQDSKVPDNELAVQPANNEDNKPSAAADNEISKTDQNSNVEQNTSDFATTTNITSSTTSVASTTKSSSESSTKILSPNNMDNQKQVLAVNKGEEIDSKKKTNDDTNSGSSVHSDMKVTTSAKTDVKLELNENKLPGGKENDNKIVTEISKISEKGNVPGIPIADEKENEIPDLPENTKLNPNVDEFSNNLSEDDTDSLYGKKQHSAIVPDVKEPKLSNDLSSAIDKAEDKTDILLDREQEPNIDMESDFGESEFSNRDNGRSPIEHIQVIPMSQGIFPEQDDSHFFFYFLTIIFIVMAGYLIFHNKQKIIALIVEGRHERRRRSHGVGYKKLDTK